ncbi:MAG: hypothetical protein ABMA15_08665 [Vicinamibacterales bacterium]
MEISEAELRTMIRDAIARHAGPGRVSGLTSAPAVGAGCATGSHGSHGTFMVEPVGDGECIIEPSVRCDHCGYCKSLGH